MTVTVNNVQVEFHLNPPKVTFLQGASMVVDDIRDNLRSVEESEEGRLAPFRRICSASGNEDFSADGSVKNALTVTVLSPYVMEFEAGAIPFQSSQGNLLGTFLDSPGAIVQINNAVGSLNLSSDQVEHASFDDSVTIDIVNGTAGTGSNAAGRPIGTGRVPSNNLDDALAIAVERGFDKLDIKGHLTVSAIQSIAGYHVYGQGATINTAKTIITLEDGASTSRTHFYDCQVTGRQQGEAFYHRCIIDEIWNSHCFFEGCGFKSPSIGTFTVQQSDGPSAGHMTYLTDCYSDEGTAIIDRNGVQESQRYSDWSGNIKFINQNNPDVGDIWLHIVGGSVEIDATCTEGTFHITGDGEIINNSGGSKVLTGVLQKIDDARIAVESLRPTHQGYGKTIYVDPQDGDDINEGETQITAVATFARAHELVETGANDVILFLNPLSSTYTHNEDIMITKDNVHMRSSSRDITFKAATDNGVSPGNAVITIDGYGCSLSGILVDGDKAGAISADYGVIVNGKFSAMNYLWVKQSALDCIQYRGGDYHTILDGEIEKANRHGVSTDDYDLPSGSPREISVFGRTNIYLNAGDGIHLGARVGEKGSTTRLVRVLSGEITSNSGYGIHADVDVDGLTLGSEVVLHNNNGDHHAPQTNILTTSFHNHYDEQHEQTAEAVQELTGRMLQLLLESHRGRHTAQGNIYFVAPTTGVDDLEHGSLADPCQSIQYVHDNLVTDSNHDLIIVLADSGGGVTTIDEQVTISKRYTFVRGPGTDVLWTSTSTGDVITITADGVEISGFEGSTHTAGNGNFIAVDNADAYKIHNIHCNYSRRSAVSVNGGSRGEIYDLNLHGTGTNGAANAIELIGLTNNITHTLVCNNVIADSTGDSISVTGNNCEDNQIHHNVLNTSGSHGILIGAGVQRTALINNRIGNSTGDDIRDQGTDTMDQGNKMAKEVWEYDIRTTPGADSAAGRILLDANKIVKNKTITDPIAGTITVYDDDDTVLFTAPLWENIAATQPYRGQGAERREKLV